ncbi:MAG: cation-translocating P-type ATPase [Bariatricus sp.]|uniref:cation-translocating P-type ATPase n=1 Tax=Bariatricus sp. HCP3S3_E12 TaxID=3438906 RepID=UPI002A7B9F14|nr:cation-translocating P-type ATPase [Bariatricus sp.]MDY4194853.1 cation-translocating P-type ATPase [Bariatricus sp.]
MFTKDRSREEDERVRGEIVRVKPDYRAGLTEEQVRTRVENGWTNEEVAPPALTTKEIIHKNVFTYFNLIFLVLAILLCIVGSFRNLTFLPVIIANTMIGIIQEIRAKRVLEKLNMLNAPHAEVVRDGNVRKIDAIDLVIDDIVIFGAGNQICADAVVEEGEVRVNESLLTGESDEITKRRGDTLLSGSFIVSGKCHARLTSVGEDSYISRLTLEAGAMPEGEQSEMMRSLDRLVKVVGIALIPIGIVLFVQGFFFNGESFRESIVSMVAAVIGMIPEGLYLLASVAMVVSAMRLAKKRVLLHDMKSIETLARVDVLCVDKTGTITENSMCVNKVVRAKGYEEETMPPLEEMIGDFVKEMEADNATMAALKEFFKENSGKKPDKVIPFSSTVKYSGVIYGENAYVLGAPEFVLRKMFSEHQDKINQFAEKGYRVLVFAKYDGIPDGKALTGEANPLGYILLLNKVRKEAPSTFAFFEQQGVEIKVISGDNPLTVSETAKQAGIRNAERYIDARELKTEEELEEAARNYTVFGRVVPEQKRQLVHALKRQGRTVAMTGDGVNDVLALKDADCSVAMASGSDAAAQASQVVLLESDFSKMPEVVLEGRRVVNNIQRSASLFLVKNIFSFLLSLFSLAFMITYPLEPSQVSLITMYTIGIPAFFLALQPNKDIIRGHFMTNVVLKALPAGLTDVIAVGALVVFGQTFDVPASDISTAATMLLAIVGFMILYRICQPMNLFRRVIWIGCVVGMLGCSIFLPDLFAITGMSTKCIMLFVVFSIATEPVLRYLTRFVEWIREGYIRLFKNPEKKRV